jgi:enoyl-CoA hydratase/carnithine racemase
METETVVVEQRRVGPVAWLTLNRPDKRNAVNGDVIIQMVTALDGIRDDQDVRCVVITGAGDVAFTAGLDFNYLLKKHKTGEGPDALHLSEVIRTYPKIVIAAVNGYCLGNGITIVSACDLAIASDRAQFGLPEIKHGGPPGLAVGATIRTLPRKFAIELNLMGKRTWDAARAEQRGLVNRVVPHDRLQSVAQEWAEEIAECPPLAVQYLKKMYLDIPDKSTTYLDGILLTRKMVNDHRAREQTLDDGLRAFLSGTRIEFRSG